MSKSRIQCFFLEPTERVRVSLRRYRSGRCPGAEAGGGTHFAPRLGCCEAVVPIGEEPDVDQVIGDLHPHDDPRWPTACVRCGGSFVDADPWQRFVDRIYRRQDTGQETTLREAPPGAMWHADWMGCKGPDGHSLWVRTPAGDWCPDVPANNGPGDKPGWTRHGTPPRVTARPSIGQHHADGRPGWAYHGFLTDGVLEEC